MSSRQLVMGSSQTLINKFNTLSSLVLEQRTFVSQQLDTFVVETNNIVNNIANLNKEIYGVWYWPNHTGAFGFIG